MPTLSVVIPAYNEEENIPRTLASIPLDILRARGLSVEVVLVDNASTDRTADVARMHGARVIVQPVRGYGNAYKAGFANSTGDVIATGDADLTYPFEIIPEALDLLESEELDFLTTDRLGSLTPEAMSRTHLWGNRALSTMSRLLFDVPFRDSQSGMWIFRRHVWSRCRVLSGGMAFSQELKVEAYRNGFRCCEVPIVYRPRGGVKKLRTVRDGARNATQLLAHRMRPPLLPAGKPASLLPAGEPAILLAAGPAAMALDGPPLAAGEEVA